MYFILFSHIGHSEACHCSVCRCVSAGVRACMCVCATGTCGPILMDLPRKMPQKVSQIYARPFINGRKMFNKCRLRRQVFKRAKEAGLCAEKGIDNEMLDVHSYT